MKISKLQELLERQKQEHGDIEVTMIGTLLDVGYSSTGPKSFPDVFESTIENTQVLGDGKLGKRLQLLWQC